MRPDDFEEHLFAQEAAELQTYAAHLLAPDIERSLVLTAHAVVERLLGDMIATKLRSPDVWLNDADFRSRTNLARAMGLIASEELEVCRVLNSVRNCVAHGLEPLPDKWRTEILRLAAWGRSPTSSPPLFDEALIRLVAHVAGPWLYARFHSAKKHAADQHRTRWMELMTERLKMHPNLESLLQNEEERKRLALDVEAALGKELLTSATEDDPGRPTGAAPDGHG